MIEKVVFVLKSVIAKNAKQTSTMIDTTIPGNFVLCLRPCLDTHRGGGGGGGGGIKTGPSQEIFRNFVSKNAVDPKNKGNFLL